MKKKLNEKGMVIVEASIVFPIILIVIFILVFAGNAYLQKAQIESVVNSYTLDGAARISNPYIKNVRENGGKDKLSEGGLQPYRFVLNINGQNIATEVQDAIDTKLNNNLGLFGNMKPTVTTTVKFERNFISSYLVTESKMEVKNPIRLFGEDFIIMKFSSTFTAPVSNPPEFIKNFNLAKNYLEMYGGAPYMNDIKDNINKVSEYITKFFDGVNTGDK